MGVLFVGGGVGAAVGGWVCDSMGRRRTILFTDVVFVVGALLLASAQQTIHLYIGRVVVGFAIAVSAVADVSYLHEIAPTEWRGSIVSSNEACIALGFLLAFSIDFVYSDYSNGWRLMFGVSGILALLQLCGMCTMPESPLWLQKKGRYAEADRVLDMVYNRKARPTTINGFDHNPPLPSSSSSSASFLSLSLPSASPLFAGGIQCTDHDDGDNDDDDDDDDEQRSITVPTPQHDMAETTSTSPTTLTGSLSAIRKYWRQSIIAVFFAIFQQLSGQTTVLSYADEIFADLGGTDSSTLWIGVVKFIAVVVVVWKIESVGRKQLLLFGMGLVVLGQCLVAVAYVLADESDGDGRRRPLSVALPGVLLVVTGYSASFGPLTWVVTSELFPTHVRGRALGISSIMTYIAASLVTSTFLSVKAIGEVFCVYAVATFVGMLFVYWYVPDTGHGKDVESIHEEVKMLWRYCFCFCCRDDDDDLDDDDDGSSGLSRMKKDHRDDDLDGSFGGRDDGGRQDEPRKERPVIEIV